MNVELTPEAALIVEGLVASGDFSTAEEAVAEGVRLLRERQKLRAEIQIGIDQLEAGECVDGPPFFEELLAHARKRVEGTP